MNKECKKIIHGIFIGTLIFIGSFSYVYADELKYQVLAPLPNTTESDGTSTLSKYLPAFFNIMIGVGAVSAFVVITIYGLELMLTDSLATKLNAKTMLENALWGLGLIIFSYAILYTINPNLLNGNLNITTPTINNPPGVVAGAGDTGNRGVTPRTYTTNPDPAGDPLVRTALTQNTTITVQRTGAPCTTTQREGCTSLSGLPDIAITGAKNLNSAAGPLVITAGTESLLHGGGVNTDHGPGQPVLDFLPTSNLNYFLGATNPTNSQVVTKTIGGRTVRFEYETAGGRSTGAHWHVIFQ